MTLDRAGFDQEMEAQRRPRPGRPGRPWVTWAGPAWSSASEMPATVFDGL